MHIAHSKHNATRINTLNQDAKWYRGVKAQGTFDGGGKEKTPVQIHPQV